MQLIYILDLIGTFVFAVSGISTARDKQFDLFGAAVIAFVTAVGGGTLRDVLIGSQPVGWMMDVNYILCIGLAVFAGILLKKPVHNLRHTLFLFDAIGIGLFTILGLEKTLSFGISPVIALMMGVVSAVFGGIIRDLLTNEVPLIFRKEFYATACIVGGGLYLALKQVLPNDDVSIAITVLFIIALRVLAVKKKWGLPIMS